MFKKITICVILLILCISNTAARDIDLDAVYIDEASPAYKKLIQGKLDAYQKAGSEKINNNVIFARWIGGTGIAYIREFPAVNILYLYTLNGKNKELLRIPGTVTTMLIDPENRYIHIKHLTISADDPVPQNHLLTLDLKTNKSRSRETNNPFLDFSLSPNGSSIVFESRQGISEEFTETGLVRLLIPVSDYNRIRSNNAHTIAILAPNRARCLLLNGGADTYKSFIWGSGNTIADISSAEEVAWLDNNSIIYRGGHSGSYNVTVVSADGKEKRQLITSSLNTNLCVSAQAGRAAFLHNQMIMLYNAKDNSVVSTGLEGEDIYFSPDGVRFISIFQKELYLTREKTLLERKNIMRANATNLLEIYKQVQNDDEVLDNEYSNNYCQQKIDAYTLFLK